MAEVTPTVERRVLPLLEHLARMGWRASEASTSPGDLRPRHVVALRLLSAGPISQQALGEALCLDPSNVVGLLNELEDRNLTIRRRDPSDRRRHIVELSPAGNAELAATCSQLGEIEDHLLGALSTDERATLYDLLARAVGGSVPPPCTSDQGGGDAAAAGDP